MIIDLCSDLHGHYPKLEGGDLLIVAGDLTARDTQQEYNEFHDWALKQDYFAVIVVAGNHDNQLQINRHILDSEDSIIVYLEDDSFEYMDIKVWGSPWTRSFEGMNPHCKAFTCDTEEELVIKFSLIPGDVDILVTHSPPLGFLDQTPDGGHVGSSALHSLLYKEKIRPNVHVFGHIHGGYGHIPKSLDMPKTQFVNASMVNEAYEPVNKPIRIFL